MVKTLKAIFKLVHRIETFLCILLALLFACAGVSLMISGKTANVLLGVFLVALCSWAGLKGIRSLKDPSGRHTARRDCPYCSQAQKVDPDSIESVCTQCGATFTTDQSEDI